MCILWNIHVIIDAFCVKCWTIERGKKNLWRISTQHSTVDKFSTPKKWTTLNGYWFWKRIMPLHVKCAHFYCFFFINILLHSLLVILFLPSDKQNRYLIVTNTKKTWNHSVHCSVDSRHNLNKRRWWLSLFQHHFIFIGVYAGGKYVSCGNKFFQANILIARALEIGKSATQI